MAKVVYDNRAKVQCGLYILFERKKNTTLFPYRVHASKSIGMVSSPARPAGLDKTHKRHAALSLAPPLIISPLIAN